MIRRRYVVAFVVFAASLALHGAVLGAKKQAEDASIAGGAAASVAQLGNSFQDMAVGVLTAEPTTDVQPAPAPRETTEQPDAPDVAQPVQPIAQDNQTVASDQNLPKLPLQPQADAVVPVAPTHSQPVPPEATQSLSQPVQDALPEPPEASVRVSRRPAVRPKTLEDTVAATRPKPEPRGNAKTQARAGVSDGTSAAAAPVAAPRKSAASTKAANAAVSNYPGQVMRRLARQRRPRAASKGTAVVAFTIAANGGVARAGLAQSSGSAQLDQDAVTLVRTAGPFPAPPSGAQRSFKVKIQGR